jgi:hypothetical protein
LSERVLAQPDAILPDNKVTLLHLRSRQRIWIAWLFAGPLTPVFWLWVLNLFRFEPGVVPPEPTPLLFAAWWLFTGLPSMIGVSIGYILYARLNLKDKGNVYLVAISSGLITLALFAVVIGAGLAMMQPSAEEGAGAAVFGAGAALFMGFVPASIMVLASYAVIRVIALEEGIAVSLA